MRVAKYSDADKTRLLKECEGMSNKQTAKKLGISEGTLYNWKSKAKTTPPTPKSKSDAKRIKALTPDTKIKVSNVKPRITVTQVKPASIKKVIKALESIKTSMQVVEGYLTMMVA